MAHDIYTTPITFSIKNMCGSAFLHFHGSGLLWLCTGYNGLVFFQTPVWYSHLRIQVTCSSGLDSKLRNHFDTLFEKCIQAA